MNNSCLLVAWRRIRKAGRLERPPSSRGSTVSWPCGRLQNATQPARLPAVFGVCCLNRPGPGDSRDKVRLQRGWAPQPTPVDCSRPGPLLPSSLAYGSQPQGVALKQSTRQNGRVGTRKARAVSDAQSQPGLVAESIQRQH